MTTKKEDIVASSSQQGSQLLHECCMCGDSGLTYELFQCKVCQFRSQHRYCSSLYPRAQSYKVCNWCLNQKEDTKEKSQNSCNSSASCKDSIEDDSKNNIKKLKSDHFTKPGLVSPGSKGSQQRNTTNPKLQVVIKKPKSPEIRSQSTTTTTTTTRRRKRIITNARLEEKLRRTKSEEMSNRELITRHVFRNKVRRYKLLDEVSS